MDNPILANSDYTSNTLVSPDGFYVIGSGWADGTMKGIKVRLEGLLSHWTLDGTAAEPDLVVDVTGNGFDGTGTESLTFVEGKIENAVAIPSGTYITIDQLIDRPDLFTVTAWVKTSSNGAVLSFHDTVGDTFSCIEIEEGGDGAVSGSLRYGQWDGSAWQKVDSVDSVNDNRWHHIAVVYDEGNVVLYVDGLVQSSNTLTNNENSAANNAFRIASNVYGAMIFEGSLDDIRLYNYAMTNVQVADVYLETEAYICVGELEYDLNDDCIVDLGDIALLATQWLECDRYGDGTCFGIVLP